MIRFAAVALALLCIGVEAQAQWQPFGGRFRRQPSYVQPQFYYGPTCPPPVTYYYTTPQYVQPTPVVPSGPKVVPAPTLPEIPKAVEVVPTVPEKVVNPVKEKNKDTGPRVLPTPKRDER